MNYTLYYIGVIILALALGIVADFIEILAFKKQLEIYNCMYPSFKILIPNKLKDLVKFKRNFEDFTFSINMLRFTNPITNLPNFYGNGKEISNEETHTD